VTTYRLLTSGTIDEKIYQRQLSKKALSDVVMVCACIQCVRLNVSGGTDTFARQDASEIRPSSFSKEELMDVFTFHDTPCNTHAILECPCQVSRSFAHFATTRKF
jgi:DNA repair and recombination protein RAD54B